ncbi:CpsD/CapB family tyrosine-protein kinase [Reinekea blandensis]|uniref:Putative polysaccharide biosynthesis protein n=1 Tax=Reinekea blandensis MED297 TaxID=314283 RepID=A4B969_9GAMM|nr:CpsD/CapB family tyrosine-protein kinase [Reinekea blandensis]EAR11170.1 putative polysaccharide biosynthesis protein [Reinekea sp. MED297] [Reinekea blandensis MED297]
MDQSKLYKAFERNKTQRSLETKAETQTSMVKTKPKTGTQVLNDLLPSDTLLTREGSVKDIRNPNPLSASVMKKNKLVYSGMKNRAVLNAYRELRIKLLDEHESGNIAVLMSSVDAKDSSIVTAMNLAISFALDVSASALLVDCNPYGTDLQKLVSAKLEAGITDYVLDREIGLENIIYPSGIDRVSVIPAGHNPLSAVEQFSSRTMQELIYELKNRYSDRFIVIHAPPVLSSSEARVLTKYCDRSVLTVPYGRAAIDAIEDCVEALGAANVSGVVYQQ